MIKKAFYNLITSLLELYKKWYPQPHPFVFNEDGYVENPKLWMVIHIDKDNIVKTGGFIGEELGVIRCMNLAGIDHKHYQYIDTMQFVDDITSKQ